MANGTRELVEEPASMFFSTFNPESPAFSNNYTVTGIHIALLKYWMEGVGVTIMTFLGLIGNILSIIVLSSKRMRNTSSCFLLCLSFCDILTLAATTLLTGIPSLLAYDSMNGSFRFNNKIAEYGYWVPIAEIFALSVMGFTGSIYFTMALTVERYLAVCQPLTFRYICTWRRAWITSLVIVIFIVLYNLPRFWEYSYSIESVGTFVISKPTSTSLRKNPTYIKYYTYLSYLILMFVIPTIFLVAFNILIYFGIRKSNKLRKHMSPHQQNENSLTKMLFGVVAVFLICNLAPAFIAVCRISRVPGSKDYIPEAEFLMIFLLVFNSSVNFLIYCASGGKFREVFCDTFCSWRKGRRLSGASDGTASTLRSFLSFNSFKTRDMARVP